LLFTGTYEHTIDAKQRLAIPADVRNRLDPQRDGEALYVVIGEGPTLCLYTERGFEKRAEELDHSQLDADEVLEYERVLFSLAQRLEVDKQGRVRLPETLLGLADPGKDVVLIGVKDHLEIRSREQWSRQLQEMLAQKPQLLRNPRKVLQKKQLPVD
jgi:MraZ protein